MKFGEFVKLNRKKNKLSQAELGNRIGLSDAAISRYENSERTNIALPTLRAILNVLHISDEELINSCPDMAEKMSVMVEPGLLAADTETITMYMKKQASKEKQLVDGFRLLNDAGQSEAVKRVQELGEIPRYRKDM